DFVDIVEARHGLIRSPGYDTRTIARAPDRAEEVGYVRALQASEHRMMTSIEEVNLRIGYQAHVHRQESEDFYTQLHDARTDRRDIRLEIDIVRGQMTAYETELHERQSAEDLAVRQMMCIHVLVARAQIDTVEDTDKCYVAAAARPPRGQYDFVDIVEARHGLIRSPGYDTRTIARAPDRAEEVGEGDGDDEPFDDDDDNDTDDEDGEPTEDEDDYTNEEEEVQLALADCFAVAVVDPIPSAGETEAFETDESAPTPRSPQTRIPFSQTRLRRA
nr:hypothetical protein [Tanacetum cinerariifolium]